MFLTNIKRCHLYTGQRVEMNFKFRFAMACLETVKLFAGLNIIIPSQCFSVFTARNFRSFFTFKSITCFPTIPNKTIRAQTRILNQRLCRGKKYLAYLFSTASCHQKKGLTPPKCTPMLYSSILTKHTWVCYVTENCPLEPCMFGLVDWKV